MEFDVADVPPKGDGWPRCEQPPALELSDGTRLSEKTGNSSGMTSEMCQPMSYDAKAVFEPIPRQVQHVMVLLPCVLPLQDQGPENWEIPFSLSAAPANFATPAIVIGATHSAAGSEPTTAPTPAVSGLYLDKVIQLPDSYILLGDFIDAGDLPGPLVVTDTSAYDYRPEIWDANGNEVQFGVRTDVQSDISWSSGYPWAYEVAKPISGPLKVSVSKVNAHRQTTMPFQLKPGRTRSQCRSGSSTCRCAWPSTTS